MTKTIRQTLARSLIKLLNKYGLKKKIISNVKDEGLNINAMATSLKDVVNYEFIGLEKSFQGTCFGHVFSKACQYVITEEKVCEDLKYVSIKYIQTNMQKCITWPKKSGMGRYKWNKTCVETSIHPKKLNIPVKTR